MPAFPGVGFLAEQFAIAAMPGLERVVMIHAAVVAGEKNDRVLRVAMLVERVEHQARAVVKLLDVVAVEPGLAVPRNADGRVDRHMRRGEGEVQEERGVLRLLCRRIPPPCPP